MNKFKSMTEIGDLIYISGFEWPEHNGLKWVVGFSERGILVEDVALSHFGLEDVFTGEIV